MPNVFSLTDCGDVGSRNRQGQSISCKVVAGVLLLLSLLLGLRWAWLSSPLLAGTSPEGSDLFASLKHRNATCQVATIFPFRAGCPQKCQRSVDDDEPMYRMTMEWYFARPNQTEGTAYEKGVNYQCPAQFANNFRAASSRMESIQTTNAGVNVKIEERMHMTLSYLCCLRRNETDWVREIMYAWVLDHYPFRFDVRYDKVECWHERFNSVTVIIVANDETQRTMMKMNQDLKQTLLSKKGIPMEVDRSQQMPFHVTLFGVFRGEKQSLQPEDNIQTDIPSIYRLVTQVSHMFEDQWTGENDMTVRHAPYFSFEGVQHAGKEQPN